ncbi:hypothetical protein FH972_023014 [Carpinus fangiana]|uniref:Helicase ATP-binding domain-containing protein n=1 Tax=Carpinus fangiana TaxID=176857 RepID=A0A5N6KU90_9ROSI|nr:hypothetical protein FH972_023014 [Carpinus fangiana]
MSIESRVKQLTSSRTGSTVVLEPTFAILEDVPPGVVNFNMVHEREPPRLFSPSKAQQSLDDMDAPRIPVHLQPRQPPPQPAQSRPSAPQTSTAAQSGAEFGKASPLRNPLKTNTYASNASNPMFNVPKHGRPEHHKPIQRPSFPPKTQTASSAAPRAPAINSTMPPAQHSFRAPTSYTAPPPPKELPPLPDVFEIPRPQQATFADIPAAPKPLFSSRGFQPVNTWKAPSQISQNFVDLTARKVEHDEDDGFNPDRATSGGTFGDYDPYNYVDSAQASDNIKALLEGAFEEDDDEKPKTRLRRRKQTAKVEEKSAVDELAEQAKGVTLQEKLEISKVQEEEEEDDGTVEGLNVKLLPHQIDGVAWMMDKEVGQRKKNGVLPKGGILADDMGLGKTIQALSLILSNTRPERDSKEATKLKIPVAAEHGTLVVAPLALIKQWEAEIKDKVESSHTLKVKVHHGPSRTRRSEDLKKYDIVITTYEILVSEHGDSSSKDDGLKVGVMGLHWYRIILDEAHKIKNRNAKMTKGAYALKSVYRWCLTGTPMQNNLDELQSLIRFLNIKPYNDLKAWKDQIGGPMKNGRGGLAMKRLQYFLKAFMKRRTKEVLKKEGGLNFGKKNAGSEEKPDKGFKIVERKVTSVVVEFDEQEQSFYDRLSARTEKSLRNMVDGSNYMGALVLLLRLRQTCNHPELIRGNLKKEKDAIDSVPAKKSGDVDDLADMFGGMSVETRTCDVCRTQLSGAAVASGAVRCIDCEEDLDKVSSKKTKGKDSTSKKNKHRSRRRVVDSDDEGDEGDGQDQATDSENKDADDEEGSFSESEIKYFSSSGEDSDHSEEDLDQLSSGDDGGDGSDMISSTKIRKLLEILNDETPEHKVIVFSEFTSMLDIVEPFLRIAGHKFVRYDGSMKNDDREASLNALRKNKNVRVLLCSLKCGSLGLNLTAASRVVILEPFWNPFVEEQAIDRVHRLNQTQDVVVYKLTVRNTVEERILALQDKKRELARTAIEGGKGVAKLSMQDILNLFRREADFDPSHEHGALPGFNRGRILDDSNQQTNTTRAISGFGGYGSDAFARRW